MTSPTRALSAWLAVLLASALAPSVSCSAGISAVYEGDVRFEHCMALDLAAAESGEAPELGPPLRKACWTEWRKFYTFGQTRDRVEWADRRVRALSGEAVEAPSASCQLAPSSLTAAPPRTAPPAGATPLVGSMASATAAPSGARAMPAASSSDLPGDACALACRTARIAGGAESDRSYEACMRGCYSAKR
jgi:hypothetical protein